MKFMISIVFVLSFSLNSFSQQVEVNQLLQLGLLLQSRGYMLTHKYEFGYLNKGESNSYLLNLSDNRYYIIYATCDVDCGDIDLFLYDRDDRKLKYSDDKSDILIIEYYSMNNQIYLLKVVMYNCRNNPCYYALIVYGK